eukprot:5070736-Lingulodinium_polyedra.AAC.1
MANEVGINTLTPLHTGGRAGFATRVWIRPRALAHTRLRRPRNRANHRGTAYPDAYRWRHCRALLWYAHRGRRSPAGKP